jgi:2-polyprenyl-3-methyl-5-hydroxy-6-metoxy-1,4-benzoquinol methylase
LAAAAEGHERVLPDNRGRSEHKNYAAYYNDETLEHVAKKEAIVLAIWKLIAEGCRATADLRLKVGL